MKSEEDDAADPAGVSPAVDARPREYRLFDASDAGPLPPTPNPPPPPPPPPATPPPTLPPLATRRAAAGARESVAEPGRLCNGSAPRDDGGLLRPAEVASAAIPLLLPAPPRSAERLLLPPPPPPSPRPPRERDAGADALASLAPVVARRTGNEPRVVENVLRAFLRAAAGALAEAGSIELRPLGSFRIATRRERCVKHPRTGLSVLVRAGRSVAFRPGKTLRDRVSVPEEIARLLSSKRAAVAAIAAVAGAGSGAEAPPQAAPPRSPAGRLVGIASGKGGTGKTVLAANLAVALALSGLEVAAVDADLGLANLHILLGMPPGSTLGGTVFSGASLDSAVVRGPAGVALVPGGAGAAALADLAPSQLDRLAASVRALARGRDAVIVDSAAGLSPRTLRLLAECDLCVVATTPEVTAMTDAYAVLKTLARAEGRAPTVALVVSVRGTS